MHMSTTKSVPFLPKPGNKISPFLPSSSVILLSPASIALTPPCFAIWMRSSWILLWRHKWKGLNSLQESRWVVGLVSIGSRCVQQHVVNKLWKSIPSLNFSAMRKSLDDKVLWGSVGTLKSQAPAKLPLLLWNLALYASEVWSLIESSTSFARQRLIKSL